MAASASLLASHRPCRRRCSRGISFVRCCGDSRSGGAAFEQLWRSSKPLTHAWLRLSTSHLWHGCSRAGDSSFVRCCLDSLSVGAASEQPWRSSDRPKHASLRLSSPHSQRDCFRARGIGFGRCCGDSRSVGAASEQHWAFIRSPDACVASASAAVALMAAQAAPPLSSCGVQPIALSMLRFGSAVLTCCVAARVLAASALSAVAATTATTAATAALLPSSIGVIQSP